MLGSPLYPLLEKKTQIQSADIPLFQIVERLERFTKKQSSLIIIIKAEEVIGIVPISKIRNEVILRAKIAKDIHSKMQEMGIILEEKAKVIEAKVREKAIKEFSEQLKSMVKSGRALGSGADQPKSLKDIKVGVLYNSIHILHKSNEKTPENPERLLKIMNLIEGRAEVFKNGVQLITKFPPVSEKELLLAHEQNYVDFIRGYCEKGGGFLGGSTYLNYNSLSVASFAIGAAIKGVNLVLNKEFDTSWVLMRPPGHHASSNKYGGFCLFNSAAVTARYLQNNKGLRKILILDWDGHAANGTQSIFYKDDSVLLISLHQDPKIGYPHSGFVTEIGLDEGRGKNINIVMPMDAGDEQYKIAFERIVTPIVADFQPDFVIGCNGFDAHFDDPIVKLSTTSLCYNNIGKFFHNNFLGKSVIITEGGYNQFNGILMVAVLEGLKGNDVKIKEQISPKPLGLDRKKKMEREFKKNFNELVGYIKDYYPGLKKGF